MSYINENVFNYQLISLLPLNNVLQQSTGRQNNVAHLHSWCVFMIQLI